MRNRLRRWLIRGDSAAVRLGRDKGQKPIVVCYPKRYPSAHFANFSSIRMVSYLLNLLEI